MQEREEEAMAELRREAEAEAQRQYDASRAKAEAADRAAWDCACGLSDWVSARRTSIIHTLADALHRQIGISV